MLTQFREMVRYASAKTVVALLRDRNAVKPAAILGVALLLFVAGTRFKVTAQSHTVRATSVEAGEQSKPVANAAPEHHGLSPKAVEVGRLLGFPITNSMVVSWIVALGDRSTGKTTICIDTIINLLRGR